MFERTSMIIVPEALGSALVGGVIYLVITGLLLAPLSLAISLVNKRFRRVDLSWIPKVVVGFALILLVQGLRHSDLQLAWAPVALAAAFCLQWLRPRLTTTGVMTLLGMGLVLSSTSVLNRQHAWTYLPTALIIVLGCTAGTWVLLAERTRAIVTAFALGIALITGPAVFALTRVGAEQVEESSAASAPDRNLLLITIDTLRADALSVYGAESGSSPALAKLASRGTVFERAYAPSPWTLPSIVSLFTSRPSAELRSGAYTYTPPGNWIPLSKRLRSRGVYTCAAISNLVAKPMAAGFEEQRFINPKILGDPVDRLPFLRDLRERLLLRQERLPFRNSTREVIDAAIGCLETAGNRPFYIWVHLFDPHDPYIVSESEFPESSGIPIGYFAPWGSFGDPTVADLQGGRTFGLGDSFWDRVRGLYRGEVRRADSGVNRLLEALERSGASGTTLVVVTADHGEEFLDHGSYYHGHSLYNEVLQVPLIFAGPGIPQGERRQTAVGLIDLMPTFLDFFGLDRDSNMLGESLLERIQDRDFAGASLPVIASGTNYGEPRTALISGGYKLIRYDITGRTELYALDSDPEERRDLSEQRGEVVQELLDSLRKAEARAPSAQGGSDQSETLENLRALGYVE